MKTVFTSNTFAPFRLAEFRYLLLTRLCSSLAGSALVIVIGYQVYQLTHDPLALGLLGLIEAIPALSLALLGGHFADRHDRRRIVLITQAVLLVCVLSYVFISLDVSRLGMTALYAVAFVVGTARGFANPASSAFEAQVIPQRWYAQAAAIMSSAGTVVSITGPVLGGLSYAAFGPTVTFSLISVAFALSFIGLLLIAPKPMPPAAADESIWQSIAAGVKYVWNDQILIGAMSLDLFAVLFGGAIALLPVFASDILKTGPAGYGILQAAPTVGVLLSSLWCARTPPMRNTGRTLLVCVAGFGVSIIAFGLSRDMVLSWLALMGTGIFDGVSMVIRSTIVRTFSPEAMRARIASVEWIFIGASNEVGAFESGVSAKLLGTAASVVAGGMVTLFVVGMVTWRARKLRNLSMHAHPIASDG